MAEHSVSGTDPSISLHVRGGDKGTMDPGYMPNALNPMGQISDVLGVVQKMNEVKQFNSVFNARQKAGRILADAPDLETGVRVLAQDPETSVFAPEAGANAMATNRALLDYSGQVGAQGRDALDHFIKGFGVVLQDPSQYDTLAKNSLELASPAIRGKLSTAFGNLKNGLLDGLDSDPDKAKGQLVQRISGYMTAAGAGGAIPQILGAPGQVDLGDHVQPTMTAPAQGAPNYLGGAPAGTVTPVGTGNDLMKGLSPGVYSSEGIRAGGKMGAGGVKRPAASVPDTVMNEVGADGKPLYPKGYKIPATDNSTLGDVPIGPAGTIASGAADKFAKSNAPDDSQRTLGLLEQQDADLDKLMQTGGFTQPGAGGEERLAIAKTLNTISGVLGGKPLIDPTAVGAGENAIKNIHTLSGNLLNQMYGVQREAALTISNIAKAVPGIDNTYLGGKMITDMLRAGAKRSAEQYNFDNVWQNKRHGDLTGAQAAFAHEHPMSDYIKPVLDKYGMTKDGFKSSEAVKKAVVDGWLTKEQAYGILNSSDFDKK